MFNIRNFIRDAKRVLTVSKKPGWSEFQVMAKVTGIGIIIIGIIGFIIYFIFSLLGLNAL